VGRFAKGMYGIEVKKSDNEMLAVIIDNQKDALLFADTLQIASQSLKLEIKQEEIIEF
jgi:hypothetical protein